MPTTDLQLAVLTALVGARMHGYALVRGAESVLGRSVAIATAYACFESLAARGWIEPDGDEIVNGRARRYYQVTALGSEALEHRADELAEQARSAHARLKFARSEGIATA